MSPEQIGTGCGESQGMLSSWPPKSIEMPQAASARRRHHRSDARWSARKLPKHLGGL